MNEKKPELDALLDPVIQWLNQNFHPHVKVIVGTTGYTLLEQQFGQHTMKHVKD